jgi:hypothetical protein
MKGKEPAQQKIKKTLSRAEIAKWGSIIFILSIFALVSFAYLNAKYESFLKSSKETTGVIKDLHGVSYNEADVEYVDDKGKTHLVKNVHDGDIYIFFQTGQKHSKGESVQILYNPNNTNEISIKDVGSEKSVNTLFLIGGIFFLCLSMLSVYMFFRIKKTEISKI